MRLRASRTLGQAVNRSGRYNVLVVENDDALFQPSGPTIWYGVQGMKDLTTRKYVEPVDEGHQGLADIERFLRQTRHQPPTDDLNKKEVFIDAKHTGMAITPERTDQTGAATARLL
jgi:hypothetical protein